MSSTDIVVNRPPPLPPATLTVGERPNNLFNYFDNKELDVNNSSSGSSSTSSSTIISSNIATTTTTSSNASSNSSSFIQLSNDDQLENGSSQVSTAATTAAAEMMTPKIMIKNRKLVKRKKKKIEINNKFILNAFVNGFAQLKLSADKIDYEYIIEIYWSNSMKTFIKRTYDDFVLFHRKLIQIFNKNNNIENEQHQQHQQQQQQQKEKVIPTLPGKKPFWVNHLKLAELREIELNSYVQRLIKLPIHISYSSLILEFFETQSCDPKPIINFNNISDFENNNYTSDDDIDRDSDYDDKENYLKEDNFEDDVDLIKNLRINNYQQQKQQNFNNNNNCDDGEAGLWWDEDNALNELTMSSSFNNYNSSLVDNSANLFTNAHDLDCLENILSTYRFNDSSD